MERLPNKKSRAARLSVWSNSLLIVINVIAGILSGSVSILSEAIHTLLDLMAAAMAYFSVKISETPADERHPYGHGKFENISGVVEALLIFVASGWIIYHAVSRLIGDHEEIGHQGLGLGFIVMMVSAVINLFVSRRLYKVSKETDSVALKADALHLSTHVYTSAGVGISLLVIYFTDWHFLDPVAAIVVASYILKEAYEILVEAYRPLTDNALPDSEVRLIRQIIQNRVSGQPMDFDMVRTRKTGSGRELDFHLKVPGDMTVSDSHTLCDHIEEELREKLPNLKVTIHVEPGDHHEGAR